MANKYTKIYDINYSDVNQNLECKMSSILNFICDVGTNQSEVLGDTIEKLKEEKMAWVFYKYDVQIYKYPKYRDRISITTEPCGFKKFYAYRRYEIKDDTGDIIGEAMALFFLIHLEKRRALRIPKREYELYDVDSDLKDNIDMAEVRVSDKEDIVKKYDIRYRDIDSNNHVNNVNYVEWAIESVPLDIFENFKIKRTKVVFEKEAKYGESVQVSCSFLLKEEARIITSHIIKNSDGAELTKLELEWIKE